MIFRDPNLISRQVQRSETTSDMRIPFLLNFKFTTKRNDAVCLQLFACEPKQLQRLTVKLGMHFAILGRHFNLTAYIISDV